MTARLSKAEAARLNSKKGGRPRKTRDASPPPSVSAPTETNPPAPETDASALNNPFNLTAKELLFVAAYCGAALGNATKAYALAGFKGTGSVARSNACNLLAKDRVAKAVGAGLAKRVEQLSVMDGEEALQRISRFARADIRAVLGDDDPIAQLPADVACLIKSVTPTRYGRRIELYDALRANELVAKASGKLRELHDVRVTRSLEDILAEANAAEQAKRASA